MAVNLDLLKNLSEAFGPSGFEEEVIEIVKRELESLNIQYEVDGLGNIIAKITKNKEAKTIILDAHIDEVGLLITNITKNGFLFFEFLGGIDERILLSQRVVIKGQKGLIHGIIGAKAPHLLTPEERGKPINYRKMFIDVGASSRDEVYEMGIYEGSPATFFSEFIKQGNRIIGKAFDDRMGAFIILELLRKVRDLDLNLNIIAVFSTQEEVGIRGARVVSQNIAGSYAIALECTAANDTPGVPEQETSTVLGKGPAITIADRATISSGYLVRRLVELAKSMGIPYQFKGRMVGGTDASAYRYSKYAVPSVTISVPARYIHSPYAVIDISDIENTMKLVFEFLKDVGKRGL